MKELIPTIYGLVTDDGKFIPDIPAMFKDAFIPLRNKRIAVILKEEKKRRSESQNKYYWAVPVRMIAEHEGKTSMQTHEWLLHEFNSEIVVMAGKAHRIRKGSSELNTVEFMDDYIFHIQQWAAEELHMNIPGPNEVNY